MWIGTILSSLQNNNDYLIFILIEMQYGVANAHSFFVSRLAQGRINQFPVFLFMPITETVSFVFFSMKPPLYPRL